MIVTLLLSGAPSYAEENPEQSVAQEQRDSVSAQRMVELKEAIARGQKRQKRLNARSDEIMGRWAFAVCIGCGPRPKGFRPVHTHPLRVLAGIVAADDDAAERSRRRRI